MTQVSPEFDAAGEEERGLPLMDSRLEAVATEFCTGCIGYAIKLQRMSW